MYLGYIKLGYYGPYFYNKSDHNFIKTFDNLFIVVAILSFVISIVVGIVITNKIANPIKKVIKRTKDISDGNYVDKIEVKPSLKEIEQLATSVNVLAYNLQEQLEIKKQMVGDFTHEFLTLLPLCKAILKL